MKQYMKNYVFSFILFVVTLCFYDGPYLYAGFDMGGLSEDDIMAMQQALENEINNMSPAERENFYQIMENVERMSQEDPAMLERFITGQMSKDEEAQFVTAMVPESMAQQSPISAPQESTLATTAPEPQTPEVKEFTQEHRSIQEMITSLIAKSESFLVKMQSYPEINSKIKSWSKNKDIALPSDDKQWKDIEFDINLFIQKLFIIEHEKNNEKKKAMLDALLKNSLLFTSLATLNDTLESHEKLVDIVPFGVAKIQQETKKVIQKIISTFAQELYSNALNAMLEEALKAYESEDKKLKEEESEYIKRAQQESSKARSKEYMKSAGQEKSSSSRSGSSYSSQYDDYDYGDYGDYGSSYGSYPSSSHRSSYSPDSYSASSRYSPASSESEYSSPKRSASNDKGYDIPSSHTDHKHTSQKSSAGTAQKGHMAKKTQATKPAQQESATRKRSNEDKDVDTIENYLDKVIKIFVKEGDKKELDEIFANMADILKKSFTSNELAQLNEKLAYIVRHLTGASKSVRDTLKSLNIKLTKKAPEIKTQYKKLVEEIYKEHKGIFDKFLEQMQIVENNWGTIQHDVSKNNMYHLWDSSVEIDIPVKNLDKKGKPLPTSIIGAGEKLEEELHEAKGIIPEEKEKPTTFNDVKEAIKQLDQMIKEFIQ